MGEKKPGEEKSDRRDEQREPRERKVAPPIEREHETYSGVLEEDERQHEEKPRS